MLRIGCTGGIGAGKSSVSALLVSHGAVLLDADEISRTASAPDGAAYGAIVEHFGPSFLRSDGTLDRARLAAHVFSNEPALRELEAIVHPIVHATINRQLDQLETDHQVAVVDNAILIETGGRERYRLDGVLVVDAPAELCVERLVAYRDLSEEDARRRIANQLPEPERLQAADFVIVNVGTVDELAAMVDEAWRWIERLQRERSEST